MDRDLIDDMSSADWFVEKIRTNRVYAQNVYAALCNMRWQPLEVYPILKDEYWTCSWRAAGGIVADLRGANEDYLDWYCSGSGGFDDTVVEGFVSEGVVTDQVREDLLVLGWTPSEYPD